MALHMCKAAQVPSISESSWLYEVTERGTCRGNPAQILHFHLDTFVSKLVFSIRLTLA